MAVAEASFRFKIFIIRIEWLQFFFFFFYNLCTYLYQNRLLEHVNKNGEHGAFDTEEDVSSYWITLREKEGNRN